MISKLPYNTYFQMFYFITQDPSGAAGHHKLSKKTKQNRQTDRQT